MTVLQPLRPESFDAYLEQAVADYANDSVAAGRWRADSALECSRAEFASLLPLGLATPDQHLFEIRATADAAVAGVLWLAIERAPGSAHGFVYDLRIAPEWRRQGHALRALRAIEALAAALGATDIGLHVFSHNLAAQALYRKLAYAVTGINMHKALGVAPLAGEREA